MARSKLARKKAKPDTCVCVQATSLEPFSLLVCPKSRLHTVARGPISNQMRLSEQLGWCALEGVLIVLGRHSLCPECLLTHLKQTLALRLKSAYLSDPSLVEQMPSCVTLNCIAKL
ncbi:hypothetical protein MC885_016375 [Smutsia gigantea]|nr:hypothetical protein MC885_016375 [Smutsia gigantea]